MINAAGITSRHEGQRRQRYERMHGDTHARMYVYYSEENSYSKVDIGLLYWNIPLK